jgi:hypothetical protein
MYDFVKVYVEQDCTSDLYRNELLEFKSQFSRSTGEIEPWRIAKYKGLQIKVAPTGHVYLSGSVHKFFNGGEHNSNDYTFSDYRYTLDMLNDELGIDSNNCLIQNLEVGVNLRNLSSSTSTILDSCIITKRKKFQDQVLHNGNYRIAKLSQYALKAYDKAMQYQLPEEVFRWEMKYNKAQRINVDCRYSLSDLCRSDVSLHLGNALTKSWENVLFVDSRLIQKTAIEDGLSVMQWSNPVYWENLAKTSRGNLKNRYYRELDKCKSWTSQNSSLHYEIKEAIEDKVGSFYTSCIR